MTIETRNLAITKEDADFLSRILRATPIQGTIETLPVVMQRVVRLIQDIEAVHGNVVVKDEPKEE